MANENVEVKEKSLNFLEEIIEESIANGLSHVQTRFPPEPKRLPPYRTRKEYLHKLRFGEEVWR